MNSVYMLHLLFYVIPTVHLNGSFPKLSPSLAAIYLPTWVPTDFFGCVYFFLVLP